MTVGFNTWFKKESPTVFIVKNIAENNKRIKIFQYPIANGKERDLMTIPSVSEADIRHSLLKGELLLKLKNKEIVVIDSNIDLLQFDDIHKKILEDYGITDGLQINADELSQIQHAAFRQLIHLADGGPFEGFSSGSCMETIGGIFPTSITWYEDSSKIKKIVEKEIVRNNNKTPKNIIWKAYDTDGVSVLAKVTDTITYNGAIEASRVRVLE